MVGLLASVIYLNQTPSMFEWYMVWCGIRDGYQPINTCSQEIGLCVQNRIAILGLMVNIIRRAYTTIE